MHKLLARATIAIATPAIAMFACQGPTQIKLRLSSDVACDTVVQTGVTIHSGGANEPPTAGSRACTRGASGQNEIGTLVLTPSGERDERVTATVVLGVGVTADQCAADGYKQCIVAKRRVRFVPHEPLEMPIELSTACIGKAAECGDDKTCFRGACIAPDFEPRNGCVGPECGAAAVPIASSEAGAPDAAPSDASAPPVDASADASFDAPTDAALRQPVLFRKTADPVRGLALAADTLYYTLAGPRLPQSTPLAGDASAPVPGTVAASYWGIQVRNGELLLAEDPVLFGFCGRRIQLSSVGTTEYNCGPNSGGVGIAAPPTAPSVVICGGDVHYFSAFFGSAPLLTEPGLNTAYAKFDSIDSKAVMTSDRQLVVLSPVASDAGPSTVALGGFLGARGLALSATEYIVASTDTIIAQARATSGPQRILLPAGIMTSLEDLAYDDATRKLYIAGATVAHGSGIYTLIVEPQ